MTAAKNVAHRIKSTSQRNTMSGNKGKGKKNIEELS